MIKFRDILIIMPLKKSSPVIFFSLWYIILWDSNTTGEPQFSLEQVKEQQFIVVQLDEDKWFSPLCSLMIAKILRTQKASVLVVQDEYVHIQIKHILVIFASIHRSTLTKNLSYQVMIFFWNIFCFNFCRLFVAENAEDVGSECWMLS